jgi:hypothetical protein
MAKRREEKREEKRTARSLRRFLDLELVQVRRVRFRVSCSFLCAPKTVPNDQRSATKDDVGYENAPVPPLQACSASWRALRRRGSWRGNGESGRERDRRGRWEESEREEKHDGETAMGRGSG